MLFCPSSNVIIFFDELAKNLARGHYASVVESCSNKIPNTWECFEGVMIMPAVDEGAGVEHKHVLSRQALSLGQIRP